MIIIPLSQLRNFVFVFHMIKISRKHKDPNIMVEIYDYHPEDIETIRFGLQTYFNDNSISIFCLTKRSQFSEHSRVTIVSKNNQAGETKFDSNTELIEFSNEEFDYFYRLISKTLPQSLGDLSDNKKEYFIYVLENTVKLEVLPLLKIYYQCEVQCWENILRIENKSFKTNQKEKILNAAIEEVLNEIIKIKQQTGLYLLEEKLNNLKKEKGEVKHEHNHFSGDRFLYIYNDYYSRFE